MHDTDPRIAVVHAWIDAWNNKDWDGVADLFAPNGVNRSMMHEPVIGREAIRARTKLMGEKLDDVHLRLLHIGVVDGLVVTERSDEFVRNGRPGALPVVAFIDVRDGLIAEKREYYDRNQMLRGLGLTEESLAHSS
jgi:Limonene-1,2-epoxide hydrolase